MSGELRVDHGVTSGTFSLDGETFDVDNNVWVVGDDDECVVIDAPHSVDGILDVVIIHPRQFLSWITVAMRVLRKSPVVDETLDRRTGSRVRIKASADTPRQLDGDSIGEGRELWMECIHGRLLVRVPR